MTNQRRQAAEAANELRDNLEEILETPTDQADELEAKKHAAAALEGLNRAEDALRLWRDHEEEPIDILDEEPFDADDETDASEEAKQALEHVEAAASLLDDEDESSQ